MSNQEAPRFFGYPIPKEGPNVPYKKEKDENPIFRGLPLVIGAWLLSKVPAAQKILYSNAGFTSLRQIEHLKEYNERYDPTVVPLSKEGAIAPSLSHEVQDDSRGSTFPGQYHSVQEYHELFSTGKLTPLAVAQSLVPLIRRDVENKSHHSTAWIDCRSEAVLAAAKESTDRYAAGKPLSIFDGVPVGIKDETKVRGYSTTMGRKANSAVFPVEDESSHAVKMLEEAGAIILGKLNMHQVGADTTNNNPTWGTPLNPHNSKYYTGGSSGGAAYAVAAGLVPVALGADGGGSIRIPASFCGVYGIKPSHHRIDDTNSSVTCLGPLAATMSDLTASYRLLSKPDSADPICSLFDRSTTSAQSSTRKIGYCKTWFERADPIVFNACKATIDYFVTKLNYELVQIDIPYLPQGQLAHAYTILAEMSTNARLSPVPSSHFLSSYNAAEKVLLAVGSQVTGYDYHLAQRMRNLLMQHLAFLYKQHPGLMIITPTSPMAGWSIDKPGDLTHGVSDANKSIRNMEYVWLANFTGNPAISVPVGYAAQEKGDGKIPIGLMAMGEWGCEEQLLSWGREAETYLHDVVEGGRVRPGNWEDVVALAQAQMK